MRDANNASKAKNSIEMAAALLAIAALLALGAAAPDASAQSQPAAGPPALRIVSPADGALVHPGETLPVTVQATPGVNFQAIGLGAAAPLQSSHARTFAPWNFTLQIPKNTPPGIYHFTALGRGAAGLSGSAPVALQIERRDMPLALLAQPARIDFESFGEEIPLVVHGAFSDAPSLDITRSSLLLFRSENPAVAAVDSRGVVTAVHPGTTVIDIRYGASGKILRVPVSTEPTTLVLSSESVAFGSQAVGSSAPARTLTIRNSGQASLVITGVETGEEFPVSDDCTQGPLPAGGSCSIHVGFVPAGAGARVGRLRIETLAVTPATEILLTGQGSSAR